MKQYTRTDTVVMALAHIGFDADLSDAEDLLDYLENEGWQVLRVDE